MKRIRNTILLAIIVVAALVFGGYIFRSRSPLEVGAPTPSLTLKRGATNVNLDDYRGKYVLVDFWSSADGASRLKSNEFNQLNCNLNSNIERLSVNFDRSHALFQEIVNRDRMYAGEQYHVAGAEATRIMRDFRLGDEYKSYLISPQGRIIAVNPDVDYIQAILKSAPTTVARR